MQNFLGALQMPDFAGDAIHIDQLKRRNALAASDEQRRNALYQRQEQEWTREDSDRERLSALGSNPNSTPEDYIRAGQPEIGNALAGRDRQQHLDDIGVLHRAAEQIENAPDPIGLTHSLIASPEISAIFQRHGIDPSSLGDMTDPTALRAEARQFRERAAAMLPQQAPEDLVQTRGPDGRPIYTPKSRAAGMQPYVAPKDDTPSSYDEYTRSQRDPRYAQFLKDRRGKGMSITSPDGTVIDIGGDGSNVGAGELTKPLQTKLQETIVSSQARLDRLNGALTQFNPEYFRAKGLANVWSARVKDFAGVNVPAAQKKFLQGYTGFQTSMKEDLTQVLHELSGAAISPSEYARLSKASPTGDELSPAEFQSKASVTVKNLTRAAMRANWALKNGIGVQSAEQLARVMPLEGIDQVFEQRANDLWQQMGGTPQARAQAIQQAKQEFGMAR